MANEAPRTVYVIEDDTALRTAYAAALTQLGHQVKTASDGQEGEVLVKQSIPDMILLDMVMPNMDGVEFLGRLRAEPATKAVRVVVVSSFESAPAIENLKVDEYLSKMQTPPEQVAAIVDRLLRQPTQS